MKLCSIDEATGLVTFTSAQMDRKQTPSEYVLQVFCICMLMTQGTQLQYTTLGGNVLALTKRARRPSIDLIRLEMGEAVGRISNMLAGMNPGDDDYVFDQAILRNVSRSASGGLQASIELHFANATPVTARVPIS